ncbi:MAG TPA: hypothetical protein VIK68_06040 [Sphingomicrobium sp.]
MSVTRRRIVSSLLGDEPVSSLGIQEHQIASAADPAEPISSVSRRFVGDPFLRWRDNPELARMVNERLARNN